MSALLLRCCSLTDSPGRYMGHSWAAGLQLSFDGKNQESSSEAVNAYLAIAGEMQGREGWLQLTCSCILSHMCLLLAVAVQ